MLDHLFQKITVYRLIYSSRKRINTKNYALLRQDIVVISKICNKLYSTLNKVDENSGPNPIANTKSEQNKLDSKKEKTYSKQIIKKISTFLKKLNII